VSWHLNQTLLLLHRLLILLILLIKTLLLGILLSTPFFFTKYTSCFINEFFFFYCFERRFCIIEGPETVQDFAKMELQEIQDNIRSRRNKIFLHMEEVMMLDVSSYN